MCLEEEFVDENGTVPRGVSGVPVVSGNCVLRSCDYMRVSVLLLSVLTLYFIGRIDYELDRRIHKLIIVVTVTVQIHRHRHRHHLRRHSSSRSSGTSRVNEDCELLGTVLSA